MNAILGKWWHREADGDRIVCDLCPRHCRMKEGDRGFCFVRQVVDGAMMLDTYGRSTGFCIDPIEKKPLNHFYPGSSVLSFGTAGCNLGCQFCQNWDISKSREVARLSAEALPDAIAMAAVELGCRSVAFTYNDPVVWAEYAIDTAKACRDAGVKTVAVTAGYMCPEPRKDFYEHIDAANVDLKAFTEAFYRQITYSKLEPVLDTLIYLKRETSVWVEITNLVIPGENDAPDEMKRMSDWIVENLGPDVPLHFSAFHPDFRMRDKPNTPHTTLLEAYRIAKAAGIHYVYVGNVHDPQHASTYCHACGELVIARDWYELSQFRIRQGACVHCGTSIPGRFEEAAGTWGRKRVPVDMRKFQSTQSSQPARSSANLMRLGAPTTTDTAHRVSLSETVPTVLHEIESRNPTSMTQSRVSSPVQLPIMDLATLSDNDKHAIQRVAQQVVVCAALRRPVPEACFEPLGDLIQQHVYGLFTTLKRGKQLRGCCGFLGRPTRLRDALIESGLRTARDDLRMPPISNVELPYLSCSVNLLSAPTIIDVEPAKRADEVVVGTHGLKITSRRGSAFGERSGLLLPGVAVEQEWSSLEFLEGVCRKAGLPGDAWMSDDTILERFEGVEIDGGMDGSVFPDPMPYAMAPGNLESLFRLKQAALQNLIALSQGGTPNYLVLDGMEGTVNALVLTAFDQQTRRPLGHWIQTSLRPGIPLQSTLFELCKLAERTLRNTRWEKNVNIDLALTVLHDPAHHGIIVGEDWDDRTLKSSLSLCDMRGVDPAKRGILALCGDRVAVAFDAERNVEQLVADVANTVRVRNHPIAIFSLGCVSTVTSLLATNCVGADTRDAPRPAAFGDGFYPAEHAARQSMVHAFETASNVHASEKCLAIMTPHAGLRFSGQIAMDAWKSAVLPETIVIVGPKHTHLGVPWAVSPSKEWSLPNGTTFPCDLDLAKAIVDGVEGMEFDAAAHLREHGAEVQLPILEQLGAGKSTQPKLVCIAMGAAAWSEIEAAAKQFADVLRSFPGKVLLVISSDMNHFAEEQENRRRDTLALDAFKLADPKQLLDVCRMNEISMCGVVPAAWILQTLKELGHDCKVEVLSYDTSGTINQDLRRVVGYAACRIE